MTLLVCINLMKILLKSGIVGVAPDGLKFVVLGLMANVHYAILSTSTC